MSNKIIFLNYKKTVTLLVIFFLILLMSALASGCAEKNLINDPTTGAINPPDSSPLIDGKYTTSTQFYDTRGYAQQLELNVKNGIVTQVNFTEISKNTLDRISQEGEEKTWDNLDSLTLSSLYYHMYSDLLLSQSPNKIETISGATQTTDRFIELAKTGFEHAVKGNHEPGQIETSDTYVIRSQIGPDGYQGVLTATFKGATLITLSYDEIRLEDGKLKSSLIDIGSNINYKAIFGTLTQDTLISQNLNPVFPEGELSPEKLKYTETLLILKDSRNSY